VCYAPARLRVCRIGCLLVDASTRGEAAEAQCQSRRPVSVSPPSVSLAAQCQSRRPVSVSPRCTVFPSQSIGPLDSIGPGDYGQERLLLMQIEYSVQQNI
jgi:hypothetical protein